MPGDKHFIVRALRSNFREKFVFLEQENGHPLGAYGWAGAKERATEFGSERAATRAALFHVAKTHNDYEVSEVRVIQRTPRDDYDERVLET